MSDASDRRCIEVIVPFLRIRSVAISGFRTIAASSRPTVKPDSPPRLHQHFRCDQHAFPVIESIAFNDLVTVCEELSEQFRVLRVFIQSRRLTKVGDESIALILEQGSNPGPN